jgi:hypothetical protein
LALAFSDLVQIFSEGFLAILRMYLPAGWSSLEFNRDWDKMVLFFILPT